MRIKHLAPHFNKHSVIKSWRSDFFFSHFNRRRRTYREERRRRTGWLRLKEMLERQRQRIYTQQKPHLVTGQRARSSQQRWLGWTAATAAARTAEQRSSAPPCVKFRAQILQRIYNSWFETHRSECQTIMFFIWTESTCGEDTLDMRKLCVRVNHCNVLQHFCDSFGV